MNRLLTSIIILAVMSTGCFYSVYAANKTAERLSVLIDNVEQAHKDGDDEKAAAFSADLKREWEEVLHYSILVTDLGHGMEITSCIAEINSFAQEGDDELYAACDRAQAQLDLFGKMQTPTFWKII